MKRNFSCNVIGSFGFVVVTLCALAASPLLAQQPPAQGAFKFANASAIPDRVLLVIDAKKLRPDGFGPGDKTGAIGILAGQHRLTASSANAKTAETTVTIQANAGATIIAFTKPVVDSVTRKIVQELQLVFQTDPPREKGKHFYVIYASPHPAANLVLNGVQQNIPALRQLKADERGSIKIESGGKAIVDFTAQQNGSFLAIVFDKPDGSLAGMLLPDYD
jgi:hypothetical protein